jgi:hypothetical protein
MLGLREGVRSPSYHVGIPVPLICSPAGAGYFGPERRHVSIAVRDLNREHRERNESMPRDDWKRARDKARVRRIWAGVHRGFNPNAHVQSASCLALQSVYDPEVERVGTVWLERQKEEHPSLDWNIDAVKMLVGAGRLSIEAMRNWTLDNFFTLANELEIPRACVFNSTYVFEAVNRVGRKEKS